jgi:hypothetical protein
MLALSLTLHEQNCFRERTRSHFAIDVQALRNILADASARLPGFVAGKEELLAVNDAFLSFSFAQMYKLPESTREVVLMLYLFFWRSAPAPIPLRVSLTLPYASPEERLVSRTVHLPTGEDYDMDDSRLFFVIPAPPAGADGVIEIRASPA